MGIAFGPVMATSSSGLASSASSSDPSFFAPPAENTLDPPAEKLTEGKLKPENAGVVEVEENAGVVVEERVGKEKGVAVKDVGNAKVVGKLNLGASGIPSVLTGVVSLEGVEVDSLDSVSFVGVVSLARVAGVSLVGVVSLAGEAGVSLVGVVVSFAGVASLTGVASFAVPLAGSCGAFSGVVTFASSFFSSGFGWEKEAKENFGAVAAGAASGAGAGAVSGATMGPEFDFPRTLAIFLVCITVASAFCHVPPSPSSTSSSTSSLSVNWRVGALFLLGSSP